MKKFLFLIVCMVLMAVQSAFAGYKEWFDPATGLYHEQWDNGSITIDPQGYSPGGNTPLEWREVNGVCQHDHALFSFRQELTSRKPDLLTRDTATENIPPFIMKDNGSGGVFTNPNMDMQVNFGPFGFTGQAGHFFALDIDSNGTYHLNQQDATFKPYNYFDYVDTTGANPSEHYVTYFSFQPRPVSSGCGWCGSPFVSSPNTLALMAGQARFDIAFDVYAGGVFIGTVVVPNLELRGFGKLTVTSNNGFQFIAQANLNNSNPVSTELDANFYNHMTFVGGAILQPVVTLKDGSTWDNTQVAGGAFVGMPLLIRVDGHRYLRSIALWANTNHDPAGEGQIKTKFTVMNSVDADGWIDRTAPDTLSVKSGTILNVDWNQGAGPAPSKVWLDGTPIDPDAPLTLTVIGDHELMLSNTDVGGKAVARLKIEVVVPPGL